jgi:hypothetical protein
MRILLSTTLLLSTVAATAFGATPAQKCEATVASLITSCSKTVGVRVGKCYADTGAACAPTDKTVVKALAKVDAKVLKVCPDAATVAAAGFGSAMDSAGLIARVKEACTGEPASLAARTFGGPQAAVLASADAALTTCLETAHAEATKLLQLEAKAYASCLKTAHAGKTCDVVKTLAKIATIETKSTAKITAVCPDLATPIGLTVPEYVGRAAAQARCMTAAGHGGSAPLALDCGPRANVTTPARGTWTQVVLDNATWGTKCGDGTDYAFWIKLPATGKPSEKVAIDLQGGGVCLFEADCEAVPARLFNALDDENPTTGLFDADPAVNPFSDWTQVFLPYCTQDVHFGGGTTSTFASVTVQRFGGLNVRAALRYVRDVLWDDLGDTEPHGFNPSRLTVLFGGESAGAFGVNYNYHYLLDDLRWAHTTAIPDSGLALDNGQALGVASLGLVVGPDTPPFGWGVRRLQPPYCLAGNCGVGPVIQAASSPRLKAVPEQQIINISNQVDDGQVGTTFFATTVDWINALRTAYCANQNKNGIRNWLPAVTAPYHTILTTASRWSTVTADGVKLPAYLAAAIANPDGVIDAVDEGTLTTDYPGVNAFACPLP